MEIDDLVAYKYKCKEKDIIWGWLTLGFVFILPGYCQTALIIIYQVTKMASPIKEKTKFYSICLLLILLVPFFSLEVFLLKFLVLITNGPELKKVNYLMTACEGIFESQFQCVLQLYIIFTRADRIPSTTQLLTLSSSIFFMAKFGHH